jgi:outer membrane protein assembly factor BamB
MWDNDEVRPSASKKKVYLALGVILLLLLSAGLFYLFPFGFAGQPSLQASKRQPSIISSKTYVNVGNILALTGDSTGFWRISQKDGSVTINRFGLSGNTDWVGEYSLNEPVWDVNGRQVILADRQSGQAYLFTDIGGMNNSILLNGQPQVVAVAETGHFMVCSLPEDGDLSSLQPNVEYYSPQGERLFGVSLENAAPLLAEVNQNGTQLFLVVSKIVDDGIENHLISYSDSGQVLWSSSLPAGAVAGLTVKTFGDRLAVAVDKLILFYSGMGQLLWQSAAQGIVHDMAFIGQSDQLVYSEQKVSVLSFQKQSLLSSLSADGSVLWQYRLKGEVPDLVGGTSALSVFVGNELAVHDVGTDGKVRWSHPISADAGKGELLQARLAAGGDGSAVLVQLSDGRMFVLRGE